MNEWGTNLTGAVFNGLVFKIIGNLKDFLEKYFIFNRSSLMNEGGNSLAVLKVSHFRSLAAHE